MFLWAEDIVHAKESMFQLNLNGLIKHILGALFLYLPLLSGTTSAFFFFFFLGYIATGKMTVN